MNGSYTGRNPQTRLQEESIHFGNFKNDNHKSRLREALKRSKHIPIIHLPAMGCKLLDDTTGLGSLRSNFRERHPRILPGGHFLVYPHTNTHAQQVGPKNIGKHLVPPTLLEVGQDMLGADLKAFEPNGDHPENLPITENKRLPNPTQEVG